LAYRKVNAEFMNALSDREIVTNWKSRCTATLNPIRKPENTTRKAIEALLASLAKSLLKMQMCKWLPSVFGSDL
jgi:hypothetical protein